MILTEQTSGRELILQTVLDLGELLARNVLLHRRRAALLVQHVVLVGRILLVLLPAQRQNVVALVPLTERRRVDNDDRVLHQGLGAHQLVVGRIVHHIDDTGLAGSSLGGPREVAGVQAESAELDVATASADRMDAGRSELKGETGEIGLFNGIQTEKQYFEVMFNGKTHPNVEQVFQLSYRHRGLIKGSN